MVSRSAFLRQLALSFMVAAATAVTAPWAMSQDVPPKLASENAHTGTFVSAQGTSFTMKDEEGKQHSHTLAADAKVTDPNGQPCEIGDLKAGQKIQVTTKEGDPKTAMKVTCIV